MLTGRCTVACQGQGQGQGAGPREVAIALDSVKFVYQVCTYICCQMEWPSTRLCEADCESALPTEGFECCDGIMNSMRVMMMHCKV